MAKTVTSGTTAYCTNAQALVYVDARLWGDLVNDDGTRASAAALATNTTLTAMLQAASGDVEMACLRGHRYEVADLQAIAAGVQPGGAPTNMTAKLAELVAWLALPKSFGRRQPHVEEMDGVGQARRTLELLEKGERIFGFTETQDAGLPDVAPLNVANSDYDNKRAVKVASRYFGATGR